MLGVVFWHLPPGLDLAWRIALGAVLSPTDTVATPIAKRAPASPRIPHRITPQTRLTDVPNRTSVALALEKVVLLAMGPQIHDVVPPPVLIAFAVPLAALLVQGGTIGRRSRGSPGVGAMGAGFTQELGRA